MIDFIRTERAEIFASPDMDWSLDGEHQKGSEHIVIENIHDEDVYKRQNIHYLSMEYESTGNNLPGSAGRFKEEIGI